MPEILSPRDSRAAPPSFGASLRAHWLVRLGARAAVLGVSPFLLYELYRAMTDRSAEHQARLGVLAFIGVNLGVFLVGAGVVVVLVEWLRRRRASISRR